MVDINQIGNLAIEFGKQRATNADNICGVKPILPGKQKQAYLDCMSKKNKHLR